MTTAVFVEYIFFYLVEQFFLLKKKMPYFDFDMASFDS